MLVFVLYNCRGDYEKGNVEQAKKMLIREKAVQYSTIKSIVLL